MWPIPTTTFLYSDSRSKSRLHTPQETWLYLAKSEMHKHRHKSEGEYLYIIPHYPRRLIITMNTYITANPLRSHSVVSPSIQFTLRGTKSLAEKTKKKRETTQIQISPFSPFPSSSPWRKRTSIDCVVLCFQKFELLDWFSRLTLGADRKRWILYKRPINKLNPRILFCFRNVAAQIKPGILNDKASGASGFKKCWISSPLWDTRV